MEPCKHQAPRCCQGNPSRRPQKAGSKKTRRGRGGRCDQKGGAPDAEGSGAPADVMDRQHLQRWLRRSLPVAFEGNGCFDRASESREGEREGGERERMWERHSSARNTLRERNLQREREREREREEKDEKRGRKQAYRDERGAAGEGEWLGQQQSARPSARVEGHE